MEKLIVVTGNKHKFEEIKKKLSGYELENISLDLKEMQGNAEEIIKEKASEAFRIVKKPCIVEDVSFGFKEWNYLPGPFFKFFLKEIGIENFNRLLKDKGARATCIIGYAKSKDEILIFKGEIDGKIVDARQDNGFGFDRIFVPDGFSKTFSEMTKEEKNMISHRGKALEKLKDYLDKNKI